jgi:hypothetical protein
MSVSRARTIIATCVAVAVLACVAAPSGSAEQSVTINHLSPRPDSSGPIPKRLEWTPVKGADSYSVGVWSEIDMLVWKLGRLTTASVDWPQDIDVEAGTYYWSVMAFKNDRPIADSGRAAFIVVR